MLGVGDTIMSKIKWRCPSGAYILVQVRNTKDLNYGSSSGIIQKEMDVIIIMTITAINSNSSAYSHLLDASHMPGTKHSTYIVPVHSPQ